jgi:hypothetical protein
MKNLLTGFMIGAVATLLWLAYKAFSGLAYNFLFCKHNNQRLEETWHDGTLKISCKTCGKVWFRPL